MLMRHPANSVLHWGGGGDSCMVVPVENTILDGVCHSSSSGIGRS